VHRNCITAEPVTLAVLAAIADNGVEVVSEPFSSCE